MNKHILTVMKWLNDKESATKEELKANAANADAAAAVALAAANAAEADSAIFWGDEYFYRTGENKQDYIDEINKTSTVTTDKQSKIDDLLDLAFELLPRDEYEKLNTIIQGL